MTPNCTKGIMEVEKACKFDILFKIFQLLSTVAGKEQIMTQDLHKNSDNGMTNQNYTFHAKHVILLCVRACF